MVLVQQPTLSHNPLVPSHIVAGGSAIYDGLGLTNQSGYGYT